MDKPVTRRSVDDLLDVIRERIGAHNTLSNERWEAHIREHQRLAEELLRSQKAANEWRTLVTDYRSGTVPREEYNAKHEALVTAQASDISRLESLIDVNTTAIHDEKVAALAKRGLLGDGRALVAAVASIVALVATAIAIFKPA